MTTIAAVERYRAFRPEDWATPSPYRGVRPMAPHLGPFSRVRSRRVYAPIRQSFRWTRLSQAEFAAVYLA